MKELENRRPLHHHTTSTLVLVEETHEGLGNRLGLAGLDLLLAKLLLGESGSVGVEAELDLEVLEGVLLLDLGALGDGTATGGTEHALDLGRVDDLGQIGLLHDGGRQEEVLLQLGSLGGGAVDLVQSRESGRGPDDEAAEVTAGGELEEVQGVDGGGLNAGDVAESKDKILAILLGVVNDQRTAALGVAATPHLTLTSTDLAGLLDALDVSTGTDGLEQGNGLGGLGDGRVGESGRGDDERDLGDGRDVVAAGHQEGSGRRSSQSGSSSETLLVQVDLLVPLAPDLGGSEHAAGTAHVTEGSLASTVGTATRDTGDTGDSAAGTPGLGRGLVASLLGDSVGLTLVLVHAGVDGMDNVRADGCL